MRCHKRYHPKNMNLNCSKESLSHLFFIFLKLGCTSFGGPVAHLGYFRNEFVARRQWLDEQSYADLISFCQFLPGPASSQVGLSIGLYRAGMWGGFMAWIGFCLPSAVILILFAKGVANLDSAITIKLIHGLKVVAVAIVAKAVWHMALKLCFEKTRITLMCLACVVTLLSPNFITQLIVMLSAAIFGLLFLKMDHREQFVRQRIAVHSRKLGLLFLALFFGILASLIWIESLTKSLELAIFSTFFKTGAMVFGGGHVVLPLLNSELIPRGWINQDLFMAGYGATQAVPGPLFTFSAYLGASILEFKNIWFGGFLCLVSIYLPSFLLIYGGLPFWENIRTYSKIQSSLSGLNAAVVGLLLAALYDPVWTGAIHSAQDFSIALASFVLLMYWKSPSWLVVALCAFYGLFV